MTERTGIRALLVHVAVAALLQLPGPRVVAQSASPVALVWQVPEQCPDREAVLAAVREHAGAARASAGGDGSLRASATITRVDDHYQLLLQLIGPGGTRAERTLVGSDCAALADAAALLIALALDQHGAAGGAATAESAESAESGTGSTERDSGVADRPRAGAARAGSSPRGGAGAGAGAGAGDEPAGEQAPATIAISPDNEVRERLAGPTAWSFAAGVALGLDAGTLPRAPAFGLEPRVQLQIDWLRAQLALGFWLARSGPSERYASAELAASGAIGRVALGFDALVAPLALGPRALFELGWLDLQTEGVSSPDHASANWLAAGAGVLAQVPIGRRFAATFELGALFPFTRTRWLLRTGAEPVAVFIAAPVVLRASGGVAYRFW